MDNELAVQEEYGNEVQQQKPEQNGDIVIHTGFDIASLLPEAGKLCTTQQQEEILFAPPIDEDIEIRPDGLIYAPWMEYQDRLTRAFGCQWVLIAEGNPKKHGNHIYWKHHLVIDGHYVTTAIGEQEYYSNNRTMSYSDAVEGAWSNSLMRCCKHMGITKELWKPSYIREWKKKFAECYTDRNGKKLWRKKGIKPETPPETPSKAPEKPQKARSQAKPPSAKGEEEKAPEKNMLDGEHMRKSIRAMVSEMFKGDKDKMVSYMTRVQGGKMVVLQELPDDEVHEIYDRVVIDYNS